MNHIVSKMCNRRRGVEKTVAYAECHDQSIVGDKRLGSGARAARVFRRSPGTDPPKK